MTDIDEEIRKALSGAELEKLKAVADEPGMLAMIGGVFASKMRYWSMLIFLIAPLLFAGAIWAGWNFFRTDDVHMMVLWGFGAGMMAFGVAMLKLWFFMEMNKYAVIREIKRVELQLAVLSNAMRDKGAS